MTINILILNKTSVELDTFLRKALSNEKLTVNVFIGHRVQYENMLMWELDHKEDSAEELILSNCSAGEDSWLSLGQQGDLTNQS